MKSSSTARYLLGVALAMLSWLVGFPSHVGAQERHIAWTLVNPRAPATLGKALTVTLRSTIPTGWHLYAISQPLGGPVRSGKR